MTTTATRTVKFEYQAAEDPSMLRLGKHQLVELAAGKGKLAAQAQRELDRRAANRAARREVGLR